ncbi:hypothetical protein L9F63_001394, partial [Diploptera punctata]
IVLSNPELKIKPSQPVLNRAIGQSMLLSCQVDTKEKNLVSKLEWHDPTGHVIRDHTDRYSALAGMHTEDMPDGLALMIPVLQTRHEGTYNCSAKYANTEDLSKTVLIRTFVAITWEDAPEDQNPIINQDYKVRCKVSANPAPLVNWLRNGEQLQTDNHFVVDTDGLIIKKATEEDDGVYTCRAIVIDTGELAERNIHVQVHTPPKIGDMKRDEKFTEGETHSIQCLAHGKPAPKFTWIKMSTSADLSKEDRFTVDENTGMLTVRGATKDDHGNYKCVVKNEAGTDERVVNITVVLKPRIVTLKNISVPTDKNAKLSCSASGRPLPTVHLDPSKEETIGSLIISSILRTDDGLYECIASNMGGTATKMGHLTVEFAPSFANTPMHEAWSWHDNPVNLTCLAESIPNATITWYSKGNELLRPDPNIQTFGNGPISTLRITPRNIKYYGYYKCKAQNTHGVAEHKIELKEAKPPSEIFQAKLEVITATTITFSFVGPAESGGLPTTHYAVQYKKSHLDWNFAQNKTWPVDSPYILEGLEPQTVYDFRFAAQNDVGFGNWAASHHHTMPKRSYPEEPRILSTRQTDDDVILSPYSDHYQLTWKVPADNGEPIDQYTIKFCPVRKVDDIWTESENQCDTKDLSSSEHTLFELRNLHADTHYKIELRARNKIGYSTPGEIIIKTARGADPPVPASDGPALSSGAIVSIVVASLFVILIFIDLSCYFVNHTGLLWVICEKTRSRSKTSDEDAKLG